MPSAAPDDAHLVHWSGDCYRLIPSRFPPVNVYEGITASDRMEELAVVENLTNPRLRSHARIAPLIKAKAEADPRLQNWNLAPFAYGNPDGSYFFGEDRPCLEVATNRQTALAVSVARREAFLESTKEAPLGLDMRMLCTPVSGRFWDLRGVTLPSGQPGREARRHIGARMPTEAQGVLYSPEERASGTCIAILVGDVLRRSNQTSHFRYVWDGRSISVLYAFDNRGTEIQASALSGEEDVLAA